MVEHALGGPFDSVGGVVEVTADVRAKRPHPEHVACVSVVDGDVPQLAVLPGIRAALRTEIEQWAADRVERFRAYGPSMDGWGAWILEDGRMAAQLWVRPVRVPISHHEPYRLDPRAHRSAPIVRGRSPSESRG